MIKKVSPVNNMLIPRYRARYLSLKLVNLLQIVFVYVFVLNLHDTSWPNIFYFWKISR